MLPTLSYWALQAAEALVRLCFLYFQSLSYVNSLCFGKTVFQVNCLAGICNIGNLVASADQPWIPSRPDQWWRLPLSLLYHHGFVHVAMVTVIQWLIMRQIEQTAGWLRMFLIYFISGMGSLLVSMVPVATKVICFSCLLKCLRSLNGKQCGSRSDCSLKEQSVLGPHCLLLYLICQLC